MITKTRLFGAIVTAIAIVLLMAAPLVAKSTFTKFECTSGEPETFDEGTFTFLPNGNVHLRGMEQRIPVGSDTESRMVGSNTVEVNANFGADGLGPMWGGFRFVSDEDGVWEGTWEGKATESGVEYHATGAGQGLYRGMKVWIEVAPGSCHGRILDHE
jgi:hypothetical protein